MKGKLTLKIEQIEVKSITPESIIAALNALKTDLEEKGCQVFISVDGIPIQDATTDLIHVWMERCCPECRGTGSNTDPKRFGEACPWCNGTGRVGEWL